MHHIARRKCIIWRRPAGFTLIEMIVVLVLISIAAVALYGVFSAVVGRSADPMLRVQAVAIAQNYLEEALLKAFQDPQGDVACEASRDLYDDVLDYNCVINEVPSDQSGGTLPGLGAYTVTIVAGAGPLGMRQAAVTVRHNNRILVTLTGYRANY